MGSQKRGYSLLFSAKHILYWSHQYCISNVILLKSHNICFMEKYNKNPNFYSSVEELIFLIYVFCHSNTVAVDNYFCTEKRWKRWKPPYLKTGQYMLHNVKHFVCWKVFWEWLIQIDRFIFLRDMGTHTSCFSANFTKGSNFNEFFILFPFWQILFFKSWS